MGVSARRIACTCVLALASLGAGAPASRAYEPGFVVNTVPGITTGIAYAANPPPGLHFINFFYGGASRITGIGASTGLDQFGVRHAGEVGAVVWSTPWQVLGASWAMVGVAGIGHATLLDPVGTPVERLTGFINPGFAPVMLSWNLGGGLFAKAGLFVWAPFGTIAPGPFNNGLGSIAQPYWTIEPHAAVSYLGDGWNLTATFIYGINTRNPHSGVINGHTLNVDLTATKKFGQLELGPIGYLSTQVTSDSGCEAFYGPGVCAPGSKAGIGGLVGYDFGAVTMKLSVTNTVHTRNSFDGWRIWTKIFFPLGPS
jgi:hypothetical protein